MFFPSSTRFITEFWLSTKPYFDIMPYPHAILFTPCSSPKRHVSGFPKNVAKCAVVAQAAGNHLQNLNSRFYSAGADYDSPRSNGCAMIRNVRWITLKLTRRGCKRPQQKPKKTIQLLTSLVNLFTPPGAWYDFLMPVP